MTDKPKTDAQRRAIHVWFDLVAKVLNDNGIDKRIVIHKLKTRGLDTQWTAASFKEDVYKPIFTKVTAVKTSTEEANTTDHDVCVQGLQKWCAEEWGVVLPPFPSRWTEGQDNDR